MASPPPVPQQAAEHQRVDGEIPDQQTEHRRRQEIDLLAGADAVDGDAGNKGQQHRQRGDPRPPAQTVDQANEAGVAAAQALDGEARTVIDRGALGVIDNQIDQTTGSVRLKAEFPNADLRLWPGGFVNVRLTIETLRGVVVAPTAAIQRGPKGAFVYVAEGERASLRPVVVRQQDETQAVVAEGLAAGERVLTSGFARLSDKARIVIGADEDKPRPASQAQATSAPDGANAAPAAGDSTQQGERRRRRREGGAPQ